MTFHPSISLHFGFFLLYLAVIGHSWAIWPLVDPAWHLTKSMPYISVRGSSYHLVVIEHSEQFDPLLTPVDPCMTFDPNNAYYTSVRGSSYQIFGGHMTFLKHLDLWITFEFWSGGFENKLSNLVGPCQLAARYLEARRNALPYGVHIKTSTKVTGTRFPC